jgi:hypothetical protein
VLIEPAPIRPPGGRSRLRAILGIAAIPVLLVGVVGVAIATRPSEEPLQPGVMLSPPDPSAAPPDPDPSPTSAPTSSPSAAPLAFPDEILGLPVRPVTETVEVQADRPLEGLVAIAGYLTLVGPTEPCPSLTTTTRGSSALFCRRETLLADTPRTPFGEEERGDRWAPIGPHLHPIAMPGTYLPAVTTMSIPLERRKGAPVVVVGRFDDPRTGPCDTRHLRCEPNLSIEWIPWAAGRYSPPTDAVEPDLREVTTRLESRDLRRLRLAAVPDSGTMLELLVRPETLERVDPHAWQGLDAPRAGGPLWYLRLLDPSGTVGGAGTPGTVWLVIDDDTGAIIGRGVTGLEDTMGPIGPLD